MPNGGFKLLFHEDDLATVQAATDLITLQNWRSNQSQEFTRPQKEARVDGNYFLTRLLGGDHATKFGIGYRDTPFGTASVRGGGATARFSNGVPVEATLYRNQNTRRR